MAAYQHKYCDNVDALVNAHRAGLLTSYSYLLPMAYLCANTPNASVDTVRPTSSFVSAAESSLNSVSDFLLFYYYAGLLDVRRFDYASAKRNLLLLFTPFGKNNAVSAIQVSAYKVLILVSLIHSGKAVPLLPVSLIFSLSLPGVG